MNRRRREKTATQLAAPNGLICPLCSFWYSTADEALDYGMVYEIGEVCGHRGGTDEPCQGKVVPLTDAMIAEDEKRWAAAEEIRRALEGPSEYDLP